VIARHRPRDLAAVAAVVAGAHGAIKGMTEVNLDAYRAAGQSVGCRVGCASCCYQPVALSTPELALLVAGIHPDSRPAVIAAAARVGERTGGRWFDTRARYSRAVPCPLLEGARCGAYEHRPAACLTHFSLSRAACLREWDKRTHARQRTDRIPMPTAPKAAGVALMTGVDAAFQAAGYEVEMVELSQAFPLMVSDGARWAAGERVFGGIAQVLDGGELYSTVLGHATETAERMLTEDAV
jgi:Fe-S-cluster containining protein